MNQASLLAFLLLFSLAKMSSAPASIPTRDQIYAALSGSWTGQLEYRDFQSDERVVLPTWLDVSPAVTGSALEFLYTYDDGPTKTVTEHSTITIDPGVHQWMLASAPHAAESYRIENPAAGKHGVQFTLSGQAQENHGPVEVRIRIAVDRNLYRFTKETRSKGGEFAFRDGYVFTRRNPAPSSK